MRQLATNFVPTLLRLASSSCAILAVCGMCIMPHTAKAGSRLVAQANGKKITKTKDANGNVVIVVRGADRKGFRKVTKHIFRAGVIDGKRQGPPGRSVIVRQRRTFNSMIRYRTSFVKEMLRSAKSL